MLNRLIYSRRRRPAYNWKPAVDFSNPRVAQALSTFPSN